MANILSSVAFDWHSRRMRLVYIKLHVAGSDNTHRNDVHYRGGLHLFILGANSVIPRGRGKGCPVRPAE